MHKITCKSAFAAAVLSTVLDSEGHPAFWYVAGPKSHIIVTHAPLPAIMACVETANATMPKSVRVS